MSNIDRDALEPDIHMLWMQYVELDVIITDLKNRLCDAEREFKAVVQELKEIGEIENV